MDVQWREPKLLHHGDLGLAVKTVCTIGPCCRSLEKQRRLFSPSEVSVVCCRLWLNSPSAQELGSFPVTDQHQTIHNHQMRASCLALKERGHPTRFRLHTQGDGCLRVLLVAHTSLINGPRSGAEDELLHSKEPRGSVNMDRTTIICPCAAGPGAWFGRTSYPGYWMVLEVVEEGRCTDQKSSPAS